jgi:hypothetical protein
MDAVVTCLTAFELRMLDRVFATEFASLRDF